MLGISKSVGYAMGRNMVVGRSVKIGRMLGMSKCVGYVMGRSMRYKQECDYGQEYRVWA